MNIKIILKNKNNTEFVFDKIISFSFRKDIYQPYTSFNAKMTGNIQEPENISEIIFSINNQMIHHGLPDNITVTTTAGCDIISVASRSFTSLLIQNQMETGLKTNISINSLMSSFYTLPYITHEDSSETSYIFVKNNSNMWDGIVNLTYKLYNTYPYIRGTNCIRATPVENPEIFTYSDDMIISRGIATATKKLMSHFHMADAGGNFGTFELADNDVIEQNIIRHRFFELDRQFLYNPQQALEYRSEYSSRAKNKIFFSYSGYGGEDLFDLVNFGNFQNLPVGAVSITGNNTGIITETAVYRDKFIT